MSEQQNYANISFQEDGRLKLLIIVGTRPEVIRLSATIQKCRQYFDCILAHTGQNYDYNLNGIFFRDLKLEEPEIYLDAAGADLGETMGNILRFSYQLMQQIARASRGRVQMGPGTLYGVLTRMEKEGLIVLSENDGRRKTYLLTNAGMEALRAEYSRLRAMVRDGAWIGEGGTNEKTQL